MTKHFASLHMVLYLHTTKAPYTAPCPNVSVWEDIDHSSHVSLRFVLSSMESQSGAEAVIHYTGLSKEAVASGLKPFTQYTVTLEVGITTTSVFHTNDGCRSL